MKVNFSTADYDWVRKQIGYSVSRGISPKELGNISLLESKKLGSRPRDEKPPGREKISQIIPAGERIDWTYLKSKGGRGNHSVLLPIKIDPTVNIEKSVHMLAFSEIVSTIKNLKKINKFIDSDYFEFVRIRNDLLSYPMQVYYGKVEKGLNKDIMFKSVFSTVKKHIEMLKKIEKQQTSLDKKFPEIIKNIDRLVDGGLIQTSVFGTSGIDQSYKTARNALKRLLNKK